MGTSQLLEQLMSVTKTASVEQVFGKPEKVGEKLVIPVAAVRCCFGGGWGTGKNPSKADANNVQEGEGGGGAAGVVARPVAILEVTEQRTRVIPILDNTLVAVAGMVLGAGALFLLGRLLGRGRH